MSWGGWGDTRRPPHPEGVPSSVGWHQRPGWRHRVRVPHRWAPAAWGGPHGTEGCPGWRGCPHGMDVSPWHGWVPVAGTGQRDTDGSWGHGCCVSGCGRGVPHAEVPRAGRRGDPRLRAGGTTAPSGGRARRRCWRCAARAASWCGTARPAPRTTRSRSGECGAGTPPGRTRAPWGGCFGTGLCAWGGFPACIPALGVCMRVTPRLS